jgi:hypothetical protein
VVRFQEKVKNRDHKVSTAQSDSSDNDSSIFGHYVEATRNEIMNILKERQNKIEVLIEAKDDMERLIRIFSEFSDIKEMLQILDPRFKFCFFEEMSLSLWNIYSIAGRLLSTVFFFLVIICKPLVQQHLWIIITVIYIPAMYIFDSISEAYVLINPEDAASPQRFDFGPTIYNCSSAPKGHPLLVTYSYQIVSGWRDVLVYAFTIGFTVRQLGLAQVPIYDWITVDELMDDECETEEDEQLFSFRGQKMTWFECMDILIEGYFDAILVGKKAVKNASNPQSQVQLGYQDSATGHDNV